MIEITRTARNHAPVIRFAGLGGAGANVLDRLVLDGVDAAGCIALNTDIQALNASVAGLRIQLGRDGTRGLGTGGDPERGYAAADEAAEEITAAFEGAQLIFLCAGLGGGTGGGAGPLVAHLARKAGALVVAFATLPFTFEGRRRCAQAGEALAQISQQADMVVCFENDRIGDAAGPAAGVQQAFVATDQMLSQAMRAVAALVQRRGAMGLGLDDLAVLLRERGARFLFGYGESDGANRAHEALDRALRSPLMDRGRMLAEAKSVLVHVSGGLDLTLNEVSVLMDEFNRHVSDGTRIHFGLATDASLGRRLCVAIMSSEAGTARDPATEAQKLAPRTQPAPVRSPQPALRAPDPQPEPEDLFASAAPAAVAELEDAVADNEDETTTALESDDEPRLHPAAAIPAAHAPYAPRQRAQPAAEKKEERAEQMTLEPASRGRFDKSEPTIVDGQDLDVPTFLRRKVKVK